MASASAGIGSALPSQVGQSGNYLTTDGTIATWAAVAGGSGVTTMAAVGAVPNANAASISGVTLTMQPASLTQPGVVTIANQVLGDGIKSISTGVSKVSLGASAGAPYIWFANLEGVSPSTNFAASYFSTFGTRFNTPTTDDLHLCSANVPTFTMEKTTQHAKIWFGCVKLTFTDSSGTPGDATINKASGKSAIAAAASACVITNSLVAATDIVLITLLDTDATAIVLKAVPTANTITVTANAAATATTKFSWVVVKTF